MFLSNLFIVEIANHEIYIVRIIFVLSGGLIFPLGLLAWETPIFYVNCLNRFQSIWGLCLLLRSSFPTGGISLLSDKLRFGSRLISFHYTNDIVDNIDKFIHVGRRKWDVIGYDGDPVYDIEDHFQMFPLQLSYRVTTNSDIWQQGNDIVIDISKADLVLCSPDNFWSYLEAFDEYSFEHLDLFYEEYYQPPLYSDLDRDEDIACLEQGTYGKVFQPPSITLPRCVTKDVVGKHVPCLEFSLGQSLLLEFKGRLNTLRRSLLSRSFSLPLRNFQSPSRFLLVHS
jgi:hypothetical protein